MDCIKASLLGAPGEPGGGAGKGESNWRGAAWTDPWERGATYARVRVHVRVCWGWGLADFSYRLCLKVLIQGGLLAGF